MLFVMIMTSAVKCKLNNNNREIEQTRDTETEKERVSQWKSFDFYNRISSQIFVCHFPSSQMISAHVKYSKQLWRLFIRSTLKYQLVNVVCRLLLFFSEYLSRGVLFFELKFTKCEKKK